MNILVIEDSISTSHLLQSILKDSGYSVTSFERGRDGLTHLSNNSTDFVLLDVGLPDMDGYQVAREIREDTAVFGKPYIIMLTARTTSDDVVTGFQVGADDYIKKPFNPEELKLRIKAASRNFITSESSFIYRNIALDQEAQSATYDGKTIKLTKTEFLLLMYLIENKGKALTRRTIFQKVWDEPFFSGNRTIDVYIRRLKIKFPVLKDEIESINGIGYKLSAS